jgi:hypothetical protein
MRVGFSGKAFWTWLEQDAGEMDDGSSASHSGCNTLRIGKVGAYALHTGRACQING